MHDLRNGASQSAETTREPLVYEDVFPVGAVPDELCPLHNRSTSTPNADVTPGPVAWSGTAAPSSADIVVERVLGADGVMRMVMHQRR
jgi:hypothetical protein